jgi:tRNA1Val (adenine37-N6)-methyltransferase
MKVGTDGTLLGAWCNVEDKYRILDIGTGTGLIALMVAQRNYLATIDAIEIEKNAYEEALYNINHSPWANRINCSNKPLQEYTPDHNYDLIVTNPPFFDNSFLNKDENKTIARHTESLRFSDIIFFSKKHLYESGILSLILPPKEAELFMLEAEKNALFLTRKTTVFSTTESDKAVRVLMEFSKEKTDFIKEHKLCIETSERHQFTEEYIELTKDFFLKF